MGFLDENNMPTPKYKKDRAKLLKYLDKSYRQMLNYLLLELTFNPDNPKTIRQAQIMRQINLMIKEMDVETAKQIEALIRQAFIDGQAYHLLSIEEADNLQEARQLAQYNVVVKKKVDALVNDTYHDILLATANTSNHVRQVVQDTVKKVAQYHAVRNTRYTEQAKQLVKELSKQGLSKKITEEAFVGIVDRKGRRWNLNTYANMVIKTKVNQAFHQGIAHEMEETGFDLAVISSHGAKDACGKWEGVVISVNGQTEGYPTYAEARATNEIFHPNCEHTIHPIRSLDMLHEDDIKKHARQMQKVKGYKNRAYKRN